MSTYGTGTYGSGTYGSLTDAVTYEKTGVAVAGSRAAGVREGGTGVVVLVAALSVREKPPLRVKIDVQTPGGKHYRWAEDEPSPENVPSGVRWSDTMPGGFETMDCVLPRKPGIDYADLEQLSTIRVLGASGDVAGEYRLERAPRTSGDQVSVSPGAVGWQAHLEDDKSARMIYVDIDMTHWTGASSQRKINLAATYRLTDPSADADAVTGQPALRTAFQGAWTATSLPIAEGWYDAGPDVEIGYLFTAWKNGGNVNSGDAQWLWSANLVSDDVGTVVNTTGNLRAAGPAVGEIAATGVAKRHAMVQHHYQTGPAGGDNVEYAIAWTSLAVYGVNGVPLLGDVGLTQAYGVLASDVVRHAVGRWAPLLNVTTESVQVSSFIVPHLAFLEMTTGGEIVRQATRFGLQDWGVWDNKTFWWHNRGAFSKRWRSRVSPAQLDETGPQVDRLWESIIVQYQDVDGSTRTVGPPGSGANTEDAVLKDSDPDNPANLLGIVRRDVLVIGVSVPAAAIEVGRRFLELSQELDRSGRARIVGHVEDDRGVLHPYWRPRAGDYIEFLDAADTSPRRIVKTSKDHSTRTCELDLDAPPEGLQALLERFGAELAPLGVG